MKKTMTRNIVIMAIVTVIMAVVLSLYIKNTGTVPAADNTASLADGTYTASEQGCLSEVAVTVTVTGGKVTNVAIDASGETPELGGAAAETLADELTKAGSTAGDPGASGSASPVDLMKAMMSGEDMEMFQNYMELFDEELSTSGSPAKKGDSSQE